MRKFPHLATLLALGTSPLAFAGSSGSNNGKLQFEGFLFPANVIIDSDRTLTFCLVNQGGENELVGADGDHLTLSLPMGSSEADLEADAATLACAAKNSDWDCSPKVGTTEVVLEVGPKAGEVTVGAGATACFDISGVHVNGAVGVTFCRLQQVIDMKRAEALKTVTLATYKSEAGVIRHDDLADVQPDQHHPQTWYLNGQDITTKYYAGRVGIGTGRPKTKLHVVAPKDLLSEDGVAIQGIGALGGRFEGGLMGVEGKGPVGGEFEGSVTGMEAGGPIGGAFRGQDFGIQASTTGQGTAVRGDGWVGGDFATTDGFAALRATAPAGRQAMWIDGNSDFFGRVSMIHSGPEPALVVNHGLSVSGGPAPGKPALDVVGTASVDVLEIRGADLAEKFPVCDDVEPGMVVEIDPDHPGNLRLARGAYDPRVAGVVSGANHFPAGAILGNLPDQEGARPIALSGRVWVNVDASDDAVFPGDLLTTAETPGFAMAATDKGRAAGAVLGKAMTGLRQGEVGRVLALINLR